MSDYATLRKIISRLAQEGHGNYSEEIIRVMEAGSMGSEIIGGAGLVLKKFMKKGGSSSEQTNEMIKDFLELYKKW